MSDKHDYACEICGNTPDDEGELRHGDGCYKISEDGGGSEYIEEADKSRDTTNDERPWDTDPHCQCGHAKSKHTFGQYGGCYGCRCESFCEDLQPKLDALQADCERWSREYARQADELVAAEQQLADMTEIRNHFAESAAEATRVRINAVKSQCELAEELKAAEARVKELEAACREYLKAIDECYEATGHIKVASSSVQRQAIEAALATAPPADGAQSS